MSEILEPTEKDIDFAYALLKRMASRKQNPQLLADGTIALGDATPCTDSKLIWLTTHKDAFQAALVGSGRYVKGTLDRIYKLEVAIKP